MYSLGRPARTFPYLSRAIYPRKKRKNEEPSGAVGKRKMYHGGLRIYREGPKKKKWALRKKGKEFSSHC